MKGLMLSDVKEKLPALESIHREQEEEGHGSFMQEPSVRGRKAIFWVLDGMGIGICSLIN